MTYSVKKALRSRWIYPITAIVSYASALWNLVSAVTLNEGLALRGFHLVMVGFWTWYARDCWLRTEEKFNL